MRLLFGCLMIIAISFAATVRAADKVPPFYAMDTSFNRSGLPLDQQFDLVAKLGYSGVAWHEQAPESLGPVLKALDEHDLKMIAIYCPLKLTPDGSVTASGVFSEMVKALKGRDTIIWIHFSGKGPAIDSLTADSVVIQNLRKIADEVGKQGLRVAIYPHFWEWTQQFADAVKVARVVDRDNFGVTFNLCHTLAGGDEAKIPSLLELGRDKLMTVTICGADTGITGGKWNQLIQPLGEGSYDVGIVTRKLREIGYTGSVGFQGYGIKMPARDLLTRTMNGWRALHASP
ncbi:sugar phosphate isomerase/epimerase [Planctomycetales bacterium ZRK34]|nr:sugar phosphate isomerase/epimerase [Planctomycetales bacterium ZRK34]